MKLLASLFFFGALACASPRPPPLSVEMKYNWDILLIVGEEDPTSVKDGAKLVKHNQGLWDRRAGPITETMTAVLGIPFREKTLVAYLVQVPQHIRAKGISDPMVLDARYYTEAELCAFMTHELGHRLLLASGKPVWLHWYAMFPHEGLLTRNHIFVYALMTEVFDRLHMPECIVAEKERVKDVGPYERAWAIVDEYGSARLIEIYRQWLKK